MNRITTNVTLRKCLFCCSRCATLIITLSHKLSFSLLNYFISKVVHDLFSFRREVLANGPRLRQVRFGYFFAEFATTVRMRRNDQSCPSSINIVQN